MLNTYILELPLLQVVIETVKYSVEECVEQIVQILMKNVNIHLILIIFSVI